jgi:uncharacterized membrane protein YjjP (DUF1212 family)
VDAYGAASIRIFVLPTIVLVEDSSSGRGAQIFPLDGDGLRLDQAGQLESLIERVIAEQLPPRQVTHELHRIGDLPPRFGARVRILGHTILTLGFGLVLDPVAAAIPVYIVLGALVGLTVVFGARFDQLRLALPVLVPFAMTLLVALAVTPWIADDPVRLVSPALVSFLPGLALTLGAVELTSQQIVAGASRIVYAGAQLGLLVFGVFAALTISGVHPPTQSPDSLGSWAPWVGVALTAIGYTLFSVAPRGSLVWIALTHRHLRRPARRRPPRRGSSLGFRRRGRRDPRRSPDASHPRFPAVSRAADVRVLASRARRHRLHRPR